MKTAISLFLALVLCLSLCACSGSKIDTLMNDFEWGQSYAQVQKNLSNHNNRFEVFGKQVQEISFDCEKDQPLSAIKYIIYSEWIPLSDEASNDLAWDSLKNDYSDFRQKLAEIFGDPDIEEDKYDYDAISITEFAVWYIDDDIVTLTLNKRFVSNSWRLSLHLEIEHTT